ncbi:hypothetical protein [Pseudonocardia sp. D17]|uniref:hypothetical protein n=1 Tax=Pseudonocardia sp. D17 TaxID=882661 RepID=UPI002B3A8C8D|nr:hypothetical protein PSD17_06230 [Pseudonocardia sp. D17]
MIRTCRWGIDRIRLAESDNDETFEAVQMDERMTGRQLRAFCLKLIADLSLRPPFTPHTLCDRLAQHRGRPLKLQAADLGATASIGHLVAEAERDRILYERAATGVQQATVIYHEVVHLTRGHLVEQSALTCGELLDPGELESRELEPAASLYASWQEWEAEAGATFLLQISRRRARPDVLSSTDHLAELGMAAMFGLQMDQPR